jgi:hypothetical protein
LWVLGWPRTGGRRCGSSRSAWSRRTVVGLGRWERLGQGLDLEHRFSPTWQGSMLKHVYQAIQCTPVTRSANARPPANASGRSSRLDQPARRLPPLKMCSGATLSCGRRSVDVRRRPSKRTQSDRLCHKHVRISVAKLPTWQPTADVSLSSSTPVPGVLKPGRQAIARVKDVGLDSHLARLPRCLPADGGGHRVTLARRNWGQKTNLPLPSFKRSLMRS